MAIYWKASEEIELEEEQTEAKLEALLKESTLVISLHVINLLKRSKLTKAGHCLSLVPENMRKRMGTLTFYQMARTRSTLYPLKDIMDTIELVITVKENAECIKTDT